MSNDLETYPIIFLRIGWMTSYQGMTSSDQIAGGGSFVSERGYGHEIFNFQKSSGRVFGYVQPPGAAYNGESTTRIRIERIGASPKDESLSGVTAIWVATSPHGGTFVVGWYRNATIFRAWQAPPPEANRRHDNNEFGYYVTAASTDAILLPPDERVFGIPRGKGGIGQSNVWYADAADAQFRSDVYRYLATRQFSPPIGPSNRGSPRQPDPLLRQRVEEAAVLKTTTHYESLGYIVDSVESENVGWDLNAVHAARQLELKLEVKGLSGSQCTIELTPNEYANLQQHQDSYRVCVVTNSLTAPLLSIFAYSQESQRWQDQHGRVLAIQELVAARCSTGVLWPDEVLE